jgi:cell division protein FtsI/penicillin-binding protein 2
MNPLNGRILSMVSFDKTDPSGNPNINQFPAASIFKIVTAAAAVEKCGFNRNTELLYNGKKHTLYKSQLKKRNNKYTRRITFQNAFAQSINPVFGKIGVHYLDGSDIERYATAFGFNRNIDFEIPVSPSFVSLTEEPYHWAEIASGFNTETRISPLHAALIASAVLNQGRLIEPSIVDQIANQKGEILYRNRVTTVNQAITPRASAVINDLMEATIKSGTAKKSFSGYRKDKILSRLKMGGKTGSIDNKFHDARFDWFVGFAEEKDGSEKIVMSVLVAHEKYIGVRASRYARLTIKHYFRNYFNRQTATLKKNQPS